MRWLSTPESVRKEEISLFAILETIVAMAVAVFIAFKTGTLKYMAVSACFVPFLLLRTEQSTKIAMRLGLHLYHIFSVVSEYIEELPVNILKRVYERTIIHKVGGFFLEIIVCIYFMISGSALIIIMGLAFFCIRTISVLFTFIWHPLITFDSIPGNWRRIILYTDMKYPPEVLPDIEGENVPEELKNFKFSTIISHSFDASDWVEKIIEQSIFGFGILSWFIPALSYRLSLKSTALIWSPLSLQRHF